MAPLAFGCFGQRLCFGGGPLLGSQVAASATTGLTTPLAAENDWLTIHASQRVPAQRSEFAASPELRPQCPLAAAAAWLGVYRLTSQAMLRREDFQHCV